MKQFKMIAMYKQPDDTKKFDDWYDEHKKKASKIPHVKEFRFSKISGSPSGKSEFYLIAELIFANKDDFKSAMTSPLNMELGKDAFTNAKGIVSVHFAEEERIVEVDVDVETIHE